MLFPLNERIRGFWAPFQEDQPGWGRSLVDDLPFQASSSAPLAVTSGVLAALNEALQSKTFYGNGQGAGPSRPPTGLAQASDVLEGLLDRFNGLRFAPASNGTLAVGGSAGRPDQPGVPGGQLPALEANRIMVQWSPTSTAAERQAALSGIGGTVVRTVQTGLMRDLGQGMVEVINLPAGVSAEQAIRAYSNRPGVELAEVDWVVGTQAVSNDPYYSTNGGLWGMYSKDSPTAAGGTGTTNQFGSQAEQAWAQGYTGSSKVVVGVIDEGIDYTHPDLYLNIYLNQGEIRTLSFFNNLTDINNDGLITFRDLNDSRNATYVTDINGNGRIDAGDLLNDSRWEDGKDTDGNGYVDDLVGWDFFNNTNDPFRVSDGDDHGTHVAGTIGGIGSNSTGVAGVNWDAQLMPLKFLGPNGGSTSGALAAVNYYADMTSRYGSTATFIGTNNSWGGGGYSSLLNTAILNGAKVGNFFVAAAGNDGRNNDSTASYPSGYSTKAALGWDAVISVASITSSGALSSFSNYGLSSVDLAAPGSGINSTVAGGLYANYSGTSMATPHVTGALALLRAAYPNATPQQLLDALYKGAAPTTSLSGKTVTGGRLDINASLAILAGGGTPPPPAPSDPVRTIWGTTASDNLTGSNGGGTGADQITGVTSSLTAAANLGRGQVDTVTGGLGADRFLLADSRGIFYTDGNSNSSGTGDYLQIVDFNSAEDKLQLRNGSQYLYRNVNISGTAYTEIYLGNGDNRFNSSDELIGRLQNTSLAPGTGVSVLGTQSWTNYV